MLTISFLCLLFVPGVEYDIPPIESNSLHDHSVTRYMLTISSQCLLLVPGVEYDIPPTESNSLTILSYVTCEEQYRYRHTEARTGADTDT